MNDLHITSDTLIHLYTCWRAPVQYKDAFEMQKNQIDESLLEITNDPMPTQKMMQSKYADTFARLSIGQRIKCAPGRTDSVRMALIKYYKKQGVEGISVRAVSNYGDGYGGVWATFKDSSAREKYEAAKKASIKTELRGNVNAAKAAK